MKIIRDGEWLRVIFPYDADIIDKVKSVPGREYRKLPVKSWRLPATPWHAAMLHNALKGEKFEWDDEAKALVAANSKLGKLASKTKGKKLPGLFPYQGAAVDFLMAADGRALVGDDMGLGKTIEALGWMNLHQDVYPALTASPASVVYKWQTECNKWLDPPHSSYVIEGYSGDIPESEIYHTSYNVMVARFGQLSKIPWKLVILDECHYVKSYKAKRTRVAKALTEGAQYVIGLDGTPFWNRPIELFNTLNILDKSLWGSVWEYGNRYCAGGNEWSMFQGASNIDELKARLTNTMIRRLWDDVDSQLPPMTRTIMPVDIDRTEYDRVAEEDYSNRLARLTALYVAVGKAKAPIGIEWATDFLETTDRKLVIFAFHVDVVMAMVNALEKFGVTYITGEVSQKERASRIARFQDTSRVRVMVINTAGSEGIDLFAAHDILFVERLWVPALESQAEARLHRTGQLNAVSAYYLAARNTIDIKFAELIEHKREIFKSILNEKEVMTIILDELCP